jgi:hypothetical protein
MPAPTAETDHDRRLDGTPALPPRRGILHVDLSS